MIKSDLRMHNLDRTSPFKYFKPLVMRQHGHSPSDVIKILQSLDNELQSLYPSPEIQNIWWIARGWLGSYLSRSYTWAHPYISTDKSLTDVSDKPRWSNYLSMPCISRPELFKYILSNGSSLILSATGRGNTAPRSHIQDYISAYRDLSLGKQFTLLYDKELVNCVDGPNTIHKAYQLLDSIDNQFSANSALCVWLAQKGIYLIQSSIRESYLPSVIWGLLYSLSIIKTSLCTSLIIDCASDPVMQGAILAAKRLKGIHVGEIVHGTLIEDYYTLSLSNNYPLTYPDYFIVSDYFQKTIYREACSKDHTTEILKRVLEIVPYSSCIRNLPSNPSIQRSSRFLLIDNLGEDIAVNQSDDVQTILSLVMRLSSAIHSIGGFIDVKKHPFYGLNPFYQHLEQLQSSVKILHKNYPLKDISFQYDAFIIPMDSSAWKELVHLGKPIYFCERTITTNALEKKGLAVVIDNNSSSDIFPLLK